MAKMSPAHSTLSGEEDNSKFHDNSDCPHYHELRDNGHVAQSPGGLPIATGARLIDFVPKLPNVSQTPCTVCKCNSLATPLATSAITCGHARFTIK